MSFLGIFKGNGDKYKGRVQLYRDNVKVDELPITHLKAKKSKVIEKSVEIYSDDDPCVIRYTNCNLQIIYSLLDYLNTEKLDCLGYMYSVEEFCEEFGGYLETCSVDDLCTYSGVTHIRVV